jgi:glycine cleavage system regulatory protein
MQELSLQANWDRNLKSAILLSDTRIEFVLVAPRSTLPKKGECPMVDEMVLTIIARDRPGLVKVLSETIAEHGGNWIDSSMARLGGEFAGILRVTVPASASQALEAALARLGDAGICVEIRKGEACAVARVGRRVRLELTGVDHPGIIHRISAALSALDISIDELETRVFAGSMSGAPMFEAKAEMLVPEGVREHILRSTLEALAKDVMVDIELAAAE